MRIVVLLNNNSGRLSVRCCQEFSRARAARTGTAYCRSRPPAGREMGREMGPRAEKSAHGPPAGGPQAEKCIVHFSLLAQVLAPA